MGPDFDGWHLIPRGPHGVEASSKCEVDDPVCCFAALCDLVSTGLELGTGSSNELFDRHHVDIPHCGVGQIIGVGVRVRGDPDVGEPSECVSCFVAAALLAGEPVRELAFAVRCEHDPEVSGVKDTQLHPVENVVERVANAHLVLVAA
jgi:hypothetical protein